MTTDQLLQVLESHADKPLLFQYQKDKIVGANYHITEVKNITVDAVDCGAGTDYWKETLIQLWESPAELGKTDYMTARKALQILNKVHSIKPMDRNAEAKFEYGNEHFHTAQLFIQDYNVDEDRLLLALSVDKTECKGLNDLDNAKVAAACCPPESSCC